MTLTAQSLAVAIAGKCVCDALHVTFNAGECWGVLGANGVGKTTLLLTLAGLRAAQSGQVLLEDRALNSLPRLHIARQLGMLFQDSGDAFPATVLDTALIGRHPHLGRWAWESAADVARARGALRDVDLAGFDARMNDTLSGGERRRLALATLLTQDPRIMLLDEPVSHLDIAHQISLLTLLTGGAQSRHKTLIMSLHDINLAARFCTHLLVLCGNGEVRHGTTAEILDPGLLARAFGHPLVHLNADDKDAWVPG